MPLRPLAELVAELNRAKPSLLGGYATVLELLAEDQLAGRLELTTALVMAGGEHLSDAGRELIETAFGCHASTSYACTEAGSMEADVARRADTSLRAFLATQDVLDPTITVSLQEPVRTSGGKLRHVLTVDRSAEAPAVDRTQVGAK